MREGRAAVSEAGEWRGVRARPQAHAAAVRRTKCRRSARCGAERRRTGRAAKADAATSRLAKCATGRGRAEAARRRCGRLRAKAAAEATRSCAKAAGGRRADCTEERCSTCRRGRAKEAATATCRCRLPEATTGRLRGRAKTTGRGRAKAEIARACAGAEVWRGDGFGREVSSRDVHTRAATAPCACRRAARTERLRGCRRAAKKTAAGGRLRAKSGRGGLAERTRAERALLLLRLCAEPTPAEHRARAHSLTPRAVLPLRWRPRWTLSAMLSELLMSDGGRRTCEMETSDDRQARETSSWLATFSGRVRQQTSHWSSVTESCARSPPLASIDDG